MTALAQERILLIGDHDRQIHGALSQVLPSAAVTAVASYFDAIADLAVAGYTTVFAAAGPIERRPEPAVRMLRELAGNSRLLLFGAPGYEPLSRKMLDFGLDDYLVTPASAAELAQMFGSPPLRLVAAEAPEVAEPASSGPIELLNGLPLAEMMLESLTDHLQGAPAAALARINARIGPAMRLVQAGVNEPPPEVPDGNVLLSHAIRLENKPLGMLHLLLPRDEDETTSRHLLAQLTQLYGRMLGLEDRYRSLYRAAITDDLTGLYNSRYFHVSLAQILRKSKYAPVTLLLFDIDNFKRYNDDFGHAVGDEILKETAKLIRRCCREHDHVARMGGDEFAVIFWEKEGPRQPRDAKSPAPVSRVPQTIRQILERFRHAIATSDLKMLGPQGRGVLSISGGLAVWPYDAHDAGELYDAADKALVFGAKKSGKNSIFLIGSAEDDRVQPQ